MEELTSSKRDLPPSARRHLFRPSVRVLMLLPVAAALASWLYVQAVSRRIGPAPGYNSIKLFIPLNFVILDDTTGRPIQGARVANLSLHPGWRTLPHRNDEDLMKGAFPWQEGWSPQMTDRGGRSTFHEIAGREVRLKHLFHGTIPIAGSPEMVFGPTRGVRVCAEGYVTWIEFLDEVARLNGKPLGHNIPLLVVVRLKRVPNHSPPPPP